MQKEILAHMLAQNEMTCSFSFDQITVENSSFQLNDRTASVGFIYRHIGETINMFGLFFGVPTDIQNTTIGAADTGQGQDIQQSKDIIRMGFNMLKNLVQNTSDPEWLEMVETPFFGTVQKIRLFSHVLFHNSHHAGQISLILSKGKKY